MLFLSFGISRVQAKEVEIKFTWNLTCYTFCLWHKITASARHVICLLQS